MSTYTTNTAAHPLFGSFFATASGLIESAVQYRQYRQTVRALNALSSRELDDLGLHRGTVKTTALKVVYGL